MSKELFEKNKNAPKAIKGKLIILPSTVAAEAILKFIPKEEKNMEKAFGKKYLAYKKKVRRWI